MRLAKRIASVAVAASLVATPIVAQAAQSVAPVRTGSEVEGEGVRGGFLIPAIAVVAIILGILALTNGGGDRPHSP